MNMPQVFDYTPSAPKLRTSVDELGNIWFVAADLCKILGIVNPTRALSILDDDESTLHSMKGAMGEEREFNVISESGMYHLIFKSRKEEAQAFRKWVTSKVLPAIRQTGSYHARPAQSIEPSIIDRTRVMLADAVISFEGVEIRVYKREDGYRFIGVDCCHALGYRRPNGPLFKLDSHFKRLERLPDVFGSPRMTNTLSLDGVLELSNRCAKPRARQFHAFIKHEAISQVQIALSKT